MKNIKQVLVLCIGLALAFCTTFGFYRLLKTSVESLQYTAEIITEYELSSAQFEANIYRLSNGKNSNSYNQITEIIGKQQERHKNLKKQINSSGLLKNKELVGSISTYLNTTDNTMKKVNLWLQEYKNTNDTSDNSFNAISEIFLNQNTNYKRLKSMLWEIDKKEQSTNAFISGSIIILTWLLAVFLLYKMNKDKVIELLNTMQGKRVKLTLYAGEKRENGPTASSFSKTGYENHATSSKYKYSNGNTAFNSTPNTESGINEKQTTTNTDINTFSSANSPHSTPSDTNHTTTVFDYSKESVTESAQDKHNNLFTDNNKSEAKPNFTSEAEKTTSSNTAFNGEQTLSSGTLEWNENVSTSANDFTGSNGNTAHSFGGINAMNESTSANSENYKAKSTDKSVAFSTDTGSSISSKNTYSESQSSSYWSNHLHAENSQSENTFGTSTSSTSDEVNRLKEKLAELENAHNELLETNQEISLAYENLKMEHENSKVKEIQEASSKIIENISATIKTTEEDTEEAKELITAFDESAKLLKTTQERIIYTTKGITQITEIGEIMESVADQIKMLSMNAAIEAAHAGDVGKGFAVVAEEMGRLAVAAAENSHAISNTVKELVKDINFIAQSGGDLEKAFEKLNLQTDKVYTSVQTFSTKIKTDYEEYQKIINTNLS